MKALFVAALVLMVAGTTEGLKKPQVVRQHRNGHHFDHTELQLPNLNDQKGVMVMSCTTCTELTANIWEDLQPKLEFQKSTNRPVRKNGYAEVLDSSCLHLKNKFGLLLDSNGKATYDMSGDSTAERLIGQWTNKYVTKECTRIVRTTNERIMHHMHNFKNETDFTTKVCVDWSKSCPLIKQKPTHEALLHRL
eukprot:GILI01005152.1.p1 GENE.GILI01005152.1~~GILI01005152.1.p1  ORF type:complete len:193 (-),score=46.62 GILI01005152.1:612-1190(-)